MIRLQLPIINLKGKPYERGYQHGSIARDKVRNTVDVYLKHIKDQVGLDRNDALRKAREFVPVIEAYDPQIMEEIRGIADGSESIFEEIITANVWREIAYFRYLRTEAPGCTAVAVSREATKLGHTLIGQNHDFIEALAESTAIFEVEQDGDKANFVAVREAGVVGWLGFNSAGLGLLVNGLYSDADKGDLAVPAHIVMRGILNARSLGDAIGAVTCRKVAASCNYLLAHADGEIIDLEASPEDVEYLHPENGVLTHGNHFETNRLRVKDKNKVRLPDSLVRSARAKRLLQAKANEIEVEDIQEILRDHFGYPSSICRHTPPLMRTIISLIMDLDEKKMYLALGNPCELKYEEVSFSSFLSK